MEEENKMSDTLILTKWALALSAEQMRPLIIELVEFAMKAEMVNIGDLAPYWDDTGEPLIGGQQIHEDEED